MAHLRAGLRRLSHAGHLTNAGGGRPQSGQEAAEPPRRQDAKNAKKKEEGGQRKQQGIASSAFLFLIVSLSSWRSWRLGALAALFSASSSPDQLTTARKPGMINRGPSPAGVFPCPTDFRPTRRRPISCCANPGCRRGWGGACCG